MKSINPATGQLIKEYATHPQAEVESILTKAEACVSEWKKVSISERAKPMMALASLLKKNKESYAKLITQEMGKRFTEAVSEIEKCAWGCEYYAENADEFLQDEVVKQEGRKSYISYQPLGLILAIMPWNFPFWQVIRFAAPNLMAGNGGLLKHASNVPGCALLLEKLFQEAGFPPYLFNTLMIGSERVASLIQDSRIKGVTLTGSLHAGSEVAKLAGQQIKKTVLELGGSDPYLILQDADLEKAVNACLQSRLINNGQSCIAAKRFIVEAPLYEAFVDKLHEKMQAIQMGDPMLKGTQLGPMASQPLRDELHSQVERSVALGARCLLGGKIPARDGFYYPATLLTEVVPEMPAFDEELFGPVACVIKARHEQEGIALANQSSFGLGAGVFTEDLKKGEHIARVELQAGLCFVNDFVKSDPRLPFGGIKQSGFGRELSKVGIHEFLNIKTVVMA